MKHRMFGWMLIISASLLGVACQKTDLKNLLSDFRWGLSEACTQEWVPQNECVLGDAGFLSAIDIVDKAPAAQIKNDVASVLKNVEVQLPADAKVRPYLDPVLAFLQ